VLFERLTDDERSPGRILLLPSNACRPSISKGDWLRDSSAPGPRRKDCVAELVLECWFECDCEYE